MATWYGPGLYGNKTACGQELTKELVGVAHKTLPCGTLVEVAYGGTSVVVPVVDRGPFVKGMSWDLTSAAAELLGFTGTARIGALVQSR
jgi:rare lipoprotein A